MNRHIKSAVIALGVACVAVPAAASFFQYTTQAGKAVDTAVSMVLDGLGYAVPKTLDTTVGLTFTKVTCGTTSTPFGVTGTSRLTVQVPLTGQNVGMAWNAATATMAPPSQIYAPGTLVRWEGGTGSCIVASGTQDITVGYK